MLAGVFFVFPKPFALPADFKSVATYFYVIYKFILCGAVNSAIIKNRENCLNTLKRWNDAKRLLYCIGGNARPAAENGNALQ